MLESFQIDHFRGFAHFRLPRLGRVNLLVGPNSSGKTSVLEAVGLYLSKDPVLPFIHMQRRRGQFVYHPTYGANKRIAAADAFFGYSASTGSEIRFIGTGSARFSGECTIRAESPLTDSSDARADYPTIVFANSWEGEVGRFRTGYGTGLSLTRMGRSLAKRKQYARPPDIQTYFLTTTGQRAEAIVNLGQSLVLTEEEEQVVEALRLIDSRVQRVAYITPYDRESMDIQHGVLVKLNNVERPVSLGSLGDGMYRLLGLALAMAKCAGGCLLVDEIDTGLYYRVLPEMWSLVCKTAKRLNIQLFATTHSLDCVTALAKHCYSDTSSLDDASVQRIEAGRREAVDFRGQSLVDAVNREIEIR